MPNAPKVCVPDAYARGIVCGVLILFLAAFPAAAPAALGQSLQPEKATTAQASDPALVEPEPRHDAWQMVPQTLLPPPTDPQQIRILNRRGADFDEFSSTHVPLDQPQPRNWGRCSSSFVLSQDEIPFLKNEAIIVGVFKSHQVYLSPSHLSIYTDEKLSVEQVLEPGPTKLSTGQSIDLLMTGGSVLLGDGRIIPSDSPYELRQYVIQPNHKYVFFLYYDSYGDYFSHGASWELVNGIAVPYGPAEVERARRGESHYSGLPESIFLEKLRKAILEHEQQ
jgi:hypothetical protein